MLGTMIQSSTSWNSEKLTRSVDEMYTIRNSKPIEELPRITTIRVTI